MKVKITLKFRGREMAHTEIGFQVINKFLSEINPYGHPDFQPKLIGRGINVMISPLPRNKRAKHPNQSADSPEAAAAQPAKPETNNHGTPVQIHKPGKVQEPDHAFTNNPFAHVELNR